MSTSHDECLATLRPGQLYLWTVPTDDLSGTATADRLRVLLPADEQQQARRFRRTVDQNQFVIARSLVRFTLSRHFPVSADEWRFNRDRNRRPFVAAPATSPAVQFSLSHSEGLVACLISLSVEAAVDVEKVAYNQDLALVARQILSTAEREALNVLSGRDWTARFFDYWTLKEAYAKARGLGLSLPFSNIGFELGPADTIRAHFGSQINDDPSAWAFWLRRVSSQHTISVAAKSSFGNACNMIFRQVEFDGVNLVPKARTCGDPV